MNRRQQRNKSSAASFLLNCIARAQVSGLQMLRKWAETFHTDRALLLAYYDYPISTGLLEATNNKIKTMQRQAY